MAHPITSVNNFTYDTLKKELELSSEEKTTREIFLKAYFGDFWQDGKGNLLPDATGGRAGTITNALSKRFVSRNVIRECVERVSGAFYGKAPNWRFQVDGELVERPRKDGEEKSDLTNIDKALSSFWTKQNAPQALSTALEARLAFGRGGIRIFIPKKFKRKNIVRSETPSDTPDVTSTEPLEGEELVQFKTIEDAIAAMRIEFVDPTKSKLLDDDGELFSLVEYPIREDWTTQKSTSVIEYSFVDNQGQTYVGVVAERATESGIEANLSSPFNLDENTTFREFKGLPYVTVGLFKNNQLLNLALTCAGFSLVDNGFGEMVLTNVELKTHTIIGPSGEPEEVPEQIKRGGGITQNFVGLEDYDAATGDVKRSSPGVTFKDPSPLTAFDDGADLAYRNCLQEAGQLYALLSGDAAVSGESRVQAVADFILRISKYKSEVDEMGSWLLTTVLLWAAALCADSKYENYTIVYDSRMHVASISPSEREAAMTMREKGTISRETERVLLGVDDPALEAELILKEQKSKPEDTTLDEFKARLDVGLQMLSLNIPVATIQTFLGFTDEQVRAMEQASAEEMAALAEIEAQANQGGAGLVDEGDTPPVE